jgi:hypothetical protein
MAATEYAVFFLTGYSFMLGHSADGDRSWLLVSFFKVYNASHPTDVVISWFNSKKKLFVLSKDLHRNNLVPPD